MMLRTVILALVRTVPRYLPGRPYQDISKLGREKQIRVVEWGGGKKGDGLENLQVT